MGMPGRRFAGFSLAFSLISSSLAFPLPAQEKEKPLLHADRAPHLILAHAGPHAPVTALAFAPDGATLYVGGFDKQVRRYELKNEKWTATGAFRVPIAPGNAGVVNALAVSPDGKWVAVAGRAPIRGEAWAGTDDGIDTNSRHLSRLQWEDAGVVYLFDPAKPDGGKVIRGPRGGVRAVTFANPAPAGGPAIITAGIEWDNDKRAYSGVVRAFRVSTGEELGSQANLPSTDIPPGLAAWAAGADKHLRVAVAWQKAKPEDGGELLVWDVGGNIEKVPDTIFNAPLAVRVGKAGAAEVLSGGIEVNDNKYVGRIAVRSPEAVGKPERLWLTGDAGSIVVPLSVAPFSLKDTGDATAILAQLAPPPAGTVGRATELRLIDARGQALGKPLALTGVSEQMRPVLAASPDGRFVAVAGFSDHHVEVFTAASLAAGKPVVEKLAGDAGGFRKVAFLTGEKLWLGSATETPPKGGVVLDLDLNTRVAAPPGPKDALKLDMPDAPEPKILEPDAAKKLPARVTVTVGGAEKTISLPDGERVTAAALLPGKPAWNPALGPVVAVAHIHDWSQTVHITLYDPATGKALYRLGGRTLPVRALAFSASRALLAASGDDGTVAVWSLKDITRPLPSIEGLVVTERGADVVVASVQPKSPADGKLAADDVIESVADAKGVQKPVKTALDFILAVRALKVGDNAQIKAKGKAAVAVVIGTATGFRHPLFTLWVNPVAKDGKHDWVGWTSSGPYDASGEAGEARIGWLTPTGDPTQPVAFSGANQYRPLFYWRDFIRLLIVTADYNEAVKRRPKPRAPTLSASIRGADVLRDGRPVIREKLDTLEVTVNDPDRVLDFDRAEVRWQITGPGGVSDWKRESLAAGRALLDLSKHEWKRGEHRVHVKLFTNPAAPESAAVHSITVPVWFLPPPPVLTVRIGNDPATPNIEVPAEKTEIELTPVVDAKANPEGAAVTVSWTDSKPVTLKRNPKGTFDPVKVKLPAQGTTVILVTATNLGEGVNAEAESQSVELRVRKLAPKKVPPPTLKLLVQTASDHRTATDAPYVVSEPKATVTASAELKAALTAFEWKVSEVELAKDKWKTVTEGKWEPAKPDKTNAETRELTLPVSDKPPAPDRALLVEVRAKVANSDFATDRAIIRYDGLPDVTVTLPPAVVTTPDLNLSGGLKVTGRRPFRVRVLVTSSRTGRTREFDPTPNAMLTGWESPITLFPGENQLGYVIKYDNDQKEVRRAGLVEVRYVRPPLVAGSKPVDVGTGSVGDVTLAVVSSPDSPPSELRVNGVRTDFRTQPKPIRLFGAGIWLLTARGVPVNPGPDRLKPVPVMVGNTERESGPAAVAVKGREEVKVPAPTIRLTYQDTAIAPDRPLPPVGEAQFTFDLKVTSETPLTRVELWQGTGADTGLEQIAAVSAANAVAVPGGVELTARPMLTLRPGTENYIRVVASNDSGTESFAFNVSFAPPPVRVVIDSIAEPNGVPIPVSPGSAGELTVGREMIDVEGRVIWSFDDESIARDRNLTVVFSANGVRHLPVPVPLAKEEPGKPVRERRFKGRVYLNALGRLDPGAPSTTRVRVELRSGSRPVPIPQAGLKEAEFRVTSNDPLRRQRLHVLVVGVEVPLAQRKPLVQHVVHAVGGTVPGGNPNFTEGRFEHPRFSFAYLYTPRLAYTNAGDLNSLLNAARLDIEWRAKRAGEEWVNDVIVVYYQGEDWVDRDGRWLLHSARSMTPASGKNPADYAIRLDNLPQVPGLPVAVVNVASVAKPVGDLAVNLLCLRFAWADESGTGVLLNEMGKAVRAERTVGKILAMLDEGVSRSPISKAKPPLLDPAADSTAGDVARREIGIPKDK